MIYLTLCFYSQRAGILTKKFSFINISCFMSGFVFIQR
uniref:Uncharacterized protein n=1 Tax=Anguilla anguilla TaxID=7936 RepID=A0A0E9U109_ANGAN